MEAYRAGRLDELQKLASTPNPRAPFDNQVAAFLVGALAFKSGDEATAGRVWRSCNLEALERVITRIPLERSVRQGFLRRGLGFLGEFPSAKDVYVFATLKTGGTYLCNLLTQSIDGGVYTSMNSRNDDGRSFDYVTLFNAIGPNRVVKSHNLADRRNIFALDMLEMRPVLVTRNIFDCLHSIRHFSYPDGPGHPHGTLGNAEKLELTTSRLAAYYVEMHATWDQLIRANRPVLRLMYQDNIRDWVGAAERVFAHVGREIPRERITRAYENLERRKAENPFSLRFRKGLVGEGEASMPGYLKDRVRALYKLYPDVDFTLIDPDA
jgi:hypothetical protein